MKVALTGATRCIGSHVLTELQAHGHEATVKTAKSFGLPIVHSTINVASGREGRPSPSSRKEPDGPSGPQPCWNHRRRPTRASDGADRPACRPLCHHRQQPRPCIADIGGLGARCWSIGRDSGPGIGSRRRRHRGALGPRPEAVQGLEWNGQIVIDATNDFDPSDLDGRTSSERVAGLVGSARVVKAANTLGAAVLGADPHEAGGQRVIFVSGDDVDAKSAVIALFQDAGFFAIDPGHSDVAFTVRHLMVSKVRGHFTRFQGELALAPDPLASSVTATIELASIDTNNPQRDDDLRSANFFETDTYPTMTFRSAGIRHGEDGFDVDGELTLHGVTRPVTLALDVNGFTRDPYGGTRAGFSATTELDRGDFGISTNIPMDGGGVVIGDRIQVFIEIEAVLNPPQPTT